jgi:hypothetical protein
MKPSIKEIYTRLLTGETIQCFWNGTDAVMQYDDDRFMIRRTGGIWNILVKPIYEQVSFNPEYTEVCSILLSGERLYGTCAAGSRVSLYFSGATFYIQYSSGVIDRLTTDIYNQIRVDNTREFTLDSA